MRSTVGCLTVAITLLVALPACRFATAADNLAPPSPLPLHENRDAYSPCAAFVKDGYIVAWQSGRIGPGDLREGFNYIGDIVACRVGLDGKAAGGPVVVCKAADLQERPRAASSGDVALIVWQDLRNKKDWDVYAARVNSAGKVLDPDGFLVAGGADNQAKPAVAWDGKSFVIVWQHFNAAEGRKYEIRAARISTEGRLADPQPIRLSSQPVHCHDSSIASAGGGRSMVYWSCGHLLSSRAPQSEGVLLTDGKPTGPTHKAEGKGESHKGRPGWGNTPTFAAASAPKDGATVYLLAWRNELPVGRGNGDTNANAYILDADGKRSAVFTLSGALHRILDADIAWDGSAFVAAWTEYRSYDNRAWPPHEHVFTARIGTDGKVVGDVQLVAGARQAPSRWSYSNQIGQSAAGDRTAPAMSPAVASDGAGSTLIAYEAHPEKADTPITIAVRMLKSDAK